MYYPYYIAYMLTGFVISLVVFFWALNNGQFKDQQRARYLPLDSDQETKVVKPSRFVRIETYALFTLVCIGLAASVAVVTFVLIKAL
jgi:cbb3-type cytochrome oxidase maturation protein